MSGTTQPPHATGDGHFTKSLAELDGLQAGFYYLDKANPLPPLDCLSGRIIQTSTPTAGSALHTVPPFPHHVDILPGIDHLQKPAWCAIQNIRIEIDEIWTRLLSLTADPNLSTITHTIKNLHKQYRDATGLRDTGADAFRSILTGSTPTDLKTLLAFTCLSYAASNQLHSQQRSGSDEIFASVQACSSTISKQHERSAFFAIIQRLWPEAKRHLQIWGASESCRRPGPGCSTHQVPLDSVFGFTPEFGPGNGFGLWHSPTPAPVHQELGCGAFDFGGFSHDPPSQDDQTGYAAALSNPTTQMATCIPSAESLQKTTMFKVFLDLFKHLGELPYALSGRGSMVHDEQSLLAYFRKRPSCRDQIVDSFMKPFLHESLSKDLICQAIASVADKFVNLGYLQSIEKTVVFMVSLGNEVIDESSYQQFLEWVLGFQGNQDSPSPPTHPTRSSRRLNRGAVTKSVATR
ncbi:hypothetical protein B0T10DRAFT_131607 [Thelonectria olida]|uniref:Uncharacterized protein n=1 Tax=Thelonectria olida TaxID=1576542 RepID=A0A9P9AIV6_9HYPO|nr:hypothetical protein B0T10DRAFT_131607 [Thelonectria olida]